MDNDGPTGDKPADENASDKDYLVARLALWAGDSDEALQRLKKYRRGRGSFSIADAHDNLAKASADRTLRQLTRRLSEYKTIYSAAGIPAPETKDHILRSESKNLGGVIWVEDDREFELRGYLINLDLERDFYVRARELSERPKWLANLPDAAAGYGTAKKQITARTNGVLDLKWFIPGDLTVEVEVGDFCTITARAYWTLPQLPTQLSEISAPFMGLLNQFEKPKSSSD